MHVETIDYGHRNQQNLHYAHQQPWSAQAHSSNEDVQERIEIIPTRRVIQTRQRTRSGFKGQEVSSIFGFYSQRLIDNIKI